MLLQVICFSICENVNNVDMVIGIFFIDVFCQVKICVKLIQVFFCNIEMFFFFLNNYLVFSLLEKDIYGNEIRICEIDGVVKFNKIDIEVIVCCYLELKLELKIDKKFVVLKLRFKGYKIGYLYFVIIVLIIVDYIVIKLNVLIVFSKKNEILYYFFNVLFKEKKCFMEYDQLSWKRM